MSVEVAGESSSCSQRNSTSAFGDDNHHGGKDKNLLWRRLTERDQEITHLKTDLDGLVAERDAVEASLRGELAVTQQRLLEYQERAHQAEAQCYQLQKELAEALGLSPPASPKSAPRPCLPALSAPTSAADVVAVNKATIDRGSHPRREPCDAAKSDGNGEASAEFVVGEDGRSSHESCSRQPSEGCMDEDAEHWLEQLRHEYQEHCVALEDIAEATRLEVEAVCVKLETCKRSAASDLEQLQAEHSTTIADMQAQHARQLAQVQGQLSAGFSALEAARGELTSIAGNGHDADHALEVAHLKERLASAEEEMATARQLFMTFATEVGACAAASECEAAALLEVCGAHGDVARAATSSSVASCPPLRKRCRTQGVGHTKRQRISIARLASARRRAAAAKKTLKIEQDEWLSWRENLVQWWQQASAAGQFDDPHGRPAPQLPEDWRVRVQQEREDEAIRRYLRRQSRKGRRWRASRVVHAVANAVGVVRGVPVAARAVGTSRASQGTPLSLPSSIDGGVASARSEFDEQAVHAAHEALDESKLGTSFLMNCSKDSRAQARGGEHGLKKWMKLPKRLSQLGITSA